MIFPVHIVAVRGLIENNKKEILLVKSRHYNQWTIPGGQVDEGENLIDALIRETKEESGANIIVDKLVEIESNTGKYEGYNNVGTVPTKVIFTFICKYVDGDLCESNETAEPAWVHKDEISNYIIGKGFAERLSSYLYFDGNIRYIDNITKPEYNLKLTRYI